MRDKILIMVRLEVETSHPDIRDAIHEIETQTKLEIPSTDRVKVLESTILLTQRNQNSNPNSNGTQSKL